MVGIKCSLAEGMFSGEFAVEMDTSAGRISLFAPEDKVNTEREVVLVDVVQDNNGGGVLVYLPATPFEISSRTVTVPQSAIVRFNDPQ
jgi:hypothetical protein